MCDTITSDTIDPTQEVTASENDDVKPDVTQSEEGAEMSWGALEHTMEKVKHRGLLFRDIFTLYNYNDIMHKIR